MKPAPYAICAALLVVHFFLGAEFLAGTASANQAKTIDVTTLDDKKFVGPFGAEDEQNPRQDSFNFKAGKFSTESCLEWGFAPAPYWVRRDSQGIHFLAELKSPEHGTMRYEGIFDGKNLTVVGYWKKERWYWTIERTYRGHGQLSQTTN